MHLVADLCRGGGFDPARVSAMDMYFLCVFKRLLDVFAAKLRTEDHDQRIENVKSKLAGKRHPQ